MSEPNRSKLTKVNESLNGKVNENNAIIFYIISFIDSIEC
jgi:hypothetical protein